MRQNSGKSNTYVVRLEHFGLLGQGYLMFFAVSELPSPPTKFAPKTRAPVVRAKKRRASGPCRAVHPRCRLHTLGCFTVAGASSAGEAILRPRRDVSHKFYKNMNWSKKVLTSSRDAQNRPLAGPPGTHTSASTGRFLLRVVRCGSCAGVIDTHAHPAFLLSAGPARARTTR